MANTDENETEAVLIMSSLPGNFLHGLLLWPFLQTRKKFRILFFSPDSIFSLIAYTTWHLFKSWMWSICHSGTLQECLCQEITGISTARIFLEQYKLLLYNGRTQCLVVSTQYSFSRKSFFFTLSFIYRIGRNS